MNYIKEAENLLWHYNDLHKSIANIDRQISLLISQAGPSDLSAVAFDMTGIHSGKIDDTFNLLFELQKLKECREKTVAELAKIDEILNEISQEKGCELYGLVLRKWYVEKLPKDEISASIGYSSKQSVYDLRNKAIRKFAIRMFGIEALRAI